LLRRHRTHWHQWHHWHHLPKPPQRQLCHHHGRAGPQVLAAVLHDALAQLQAADRCVFALCKQDLHRARYGLAIHHGIDHGPACALNDVGLRNDHGTRQGAHRHRHIHKSARPQSAVGVGKLGFDFDGARCGVHRVVNKLQTPRHRHATFGLGRRDRRAAIL
jgi:hypothetical protein